MLLWSFGALQSRGVCKLSAGTLAGDHRHPTLELLNLLERDPNGNSMAAPNWRLALFPSAARLQVPTYCNQPESSFSKGSTQDFENQDALHSESPAESYGDPTWRSRVPRTGS